MKKPPERLEHVRYYPAYSLFELTRVSPEAELAHRRMSDWHWQTGEWPILLRGNAAALCRVPAARVPGIIAELQSLGWSRSGGRFQHHGVHQVRAEAVAALRSARNGGRKGAERRWTAQKAHGQPSGPDGPPNGGPIGDLKGTQKGPKGALTLVKGKSKSTSKSYRYN